MFLTVLNVWKIMPSKSDFNYEHSQNINGISCNINGISCNAKLPKSGNDAVDTPFMSVFPSC